jgi:hypothetical protein
MSNFKLLSGDNNEHIITIYTGNPKVELQYKIISEEEHDQVDFIGGMVGDVTRHEVTPDVIDIVTNNLIRRFGNAERIR